jgi:hypothetical protein
MMARRGVMGLLAGAVSLMALGSCGSSSSASYRFRMTVEVETPRGLKSGSGVLEVTARKVVALTSEEHRGDGGVSGEAVVVDLPDGPVFVLLKVAGEGQPLHSVVTHALAPDAPLNPVDNFVAAVGKLGGWFAHAEAELPRASWPLMVRFRNLADPTSLERVDPEAVGVRRIRLETTRDEVTTGIETQLTWLVAAENFHYAGTAYGDMYPLPSNAFRSGVQ